MQKSPRETAGIFSKLFFCWLTKILYVGSKRDLELDDIYDVLPEDKSSKLGDNLQLRWNEELAQSVHSFRKWNDGEESNEKSKNVHHRQPQLGRAILRVFGFQYGLLGIIAFFDECVVKILQPILLGYLIRYFGGEFTETEGYLFATGVICCSAWYVVEHHPYFFGVQHIGMQSRVAVSALVYRKALRLSVAAIRNTTIGQLVNFLSNDVNRFDQAPLMLWYLIVGPVQLAIVTYILWGYYSYYCLVGIGFFTLFVPFQSLMGHLFGKMRLEVAGKTDKRIRIMNEIVSAIRVIKMYIWEQPFAQLVLDAREDEVKSLRHVAKLKVLNYSVYYVSSKVVIFLTLLVYVLTGNYLTAEQVFVTMALYNNVRTVLTLFFPYGMSYLAELFISIRRLENFLLLEERDGGLSRLNDDTVNLSQNFEAGSIEISKVKLGSSSKKIEVTVTNLYAKWYPEFDDWTLENVSLDVKEGQLVAVIGTVGSSKSSLLQAILGELPSVSGDINVSGNLAFAAQEPWLFSGSIRQNILFGKAFDFQWYERVLEACALTRDLALLPHGDASLVGDRGISLSGGQKARVNLARAVYADRDVYLLDDPLSAVDAEVGKHLFEKCIRGILRKKAVILVTHQLQFLKPANEIILFNSGRIEIQGSYPKLVQSGINFAQLLNAQETSPPQAPPSSGRRQGLHKSPSDNGLSSRLAAIEMNVLGEYRSPVTEFEDDIENTMSFSMSMSLSHQQDSRLSSTSLVPSMLLKPSLKKQYGTFGQPESSPEPIVNEEARSSGGITFSIYWKYIRAGSKCFSFSLVVITAILTQICFTGSDVWLQFWTQIEETQKLNNGTSDSDIVNANVSSVDENKKSWISVTYDAILEDRNVQIGIYTGIIITLFVLSFTRTITFMFICLRSSVSLHRTLFQGVLRSPMRFFELNPVGRILNRFARDVGIIDEYLPLALFDTWEIPLQGLGIFVVVSLMSPILIIPALILLLVFYKVRKYYLHSARSLKRIESITRSPVFTHLSASIHGLMTIRALKVEPEFAIEFDKFQDTHSACWYLFLASSRWVGIILDWVSISYIAIVTYSLMMSNLDGSQIGLAVSSAMTLTGLFQWGVRQSAEAENQMVSVERVLEYSELTPEPPLESNPGMKPPDSWPSHGKIKMQNLSLKYGDDDPVLKDITITIHSNEKVGIVGRTGAGKSSIISTLFRLVDPCNGTLHIDDVNILSIGLHDLRSKISIIPQDPVLFLGSLRRNLDPFSEFKDIDLWNVLEDVHLKNSLQEMKTGLDTQISEGGSNFSVGERQLICLARAILRQNKILVLDEATANVDPETDALIQKTIRIKFEDCTVLTVAHRLHTVMDSNRILVLDAGRVKEFDSPYTLLQNTEGTLYQLSQQTGKASAEALFQVAKRAFETSQSQSTPSNTVHEDTVDSLPPPFAIGEEAKIELDQF